MSKLDNRILIKLQKTKGAELKEFLEAQPPIQNGEFIMDAWDKLYDEKVQGIELIAKDKDGKPFATKDQHRIYPYEQIRTIVMGPDADWKWGRMFAKWDEIERRGPAYVPGEDYNIGRANKNPNIKKQRVLVVGCGPVGLRLAIELKMGGHEVVICEKRRENMDAGKLGFTNRINRPHNWPFLKQDLAKLNGKDLLTAKQAYPVFTEPQTSSIGVAEAQCLLLKSALMLGVDVRLGADFTDCEVVPAAKGVTPTWKCSMKYDTQSAEKFKKEANVVTHEIYDCLVGCDGARSKVRECCSEYFGGVEKRKFMDSVGIVANLQKLPPKRLKELGYGLELADMNRTRMAHREFFEKLEKESNIQCDTVIYYRAGDHNYCIFTPSRASLKANNIANNLYHFADGRDKAASAAIMKEKDKMKEFALRLVKAAGIPYDPSLPNDGFMPAPNDCMAFDFSECWNTKRGIAFEVNGPDEDVDEDMAEIMHPLVALAGDSLFEPFWPMGLGLKRGWQALLDTCYAIDNLYNAPLFSFEVPGQPRPTMGEKDWDSPLDFQDHQEKLREKMALLFDFCKRTEMTEAAASGEYAKEHIINQQLKKYVCKDAESIPYLIEVDPWSRYQPLFKDASSRLKYQDKSDGVKLHPVVEFEKLKRELEWPAKHVPKKMYSYNGKINASDEAQALAKTMK